jgi:hypothetical protein
VHGAGPRTGRPPTALTIEYLDLPLILAFLDHLEEQRGNPFGAPRCVG